MGAVICSQFVSINATGRVQKCVGRWRGSVPQSRPCEMMDAASDSSILDRSLLFTLSLSLSLSVPLSLTGKRNDGHDNNNNNDQRNVYLLASVIQQFDSDHKLPPITMDPIVRAGSIVSISAAVSVFPPSLFDGGDDLSPFARHAPLITSQFQLCEFPSFSPPACLFCWWIIY